MTQRTCLVTLICSIFFAAFASAQPQPIRRTIPAPGVKPAPIPQKKGLDSNINIELSGNLPGGSAISMTLTGCGDTFTADVTTGETEIGESKIPIVTTVTYKVEKAEGAYFIEYQISARLPVPSSTTRAKARPVPSAITTNIQYRDMSLLGKIRCTPDQSVRIFRSRDQELALKVTTAEAKTL